MSDRIALEFSSDGTAWKRVEHFLSYTVEADLYIADHAFSLELANPEVEVKPGSLCKLYVNDRLELTGIVDHRLRRTDKQGKKLVVEGRDLMGLVVDSFCEEFFTVEGMKLSTLAGRLLKNVPFINRKNIVYERDLVVKIRSRRSRSASFGLTSITESSTEHRIAQIQPGMTIFQVLQQAALSTGQMFYSLPDGTFVFGRPRAGGQADFAILFDGSAGRVNALSGEVDENISRGYSQVTVIGQRQGHVDDGINVGAVNIPPATIQNPGFPFRKPYVQASFNDSQSPKQHSRLLLEKMRHDAMRLTYEMPRHSPDGRSNYGLNLIAQVTDTVHNVHGPWLVSGRAFRLSKEQGPTTMLRLSPPGLVEDGSEIRRKGGRV